ncbi:phosphoribosyltransferase family protein [Kitasatospora sp. NPDC058965]|uniref:phosphoribosyltransferase family protein n=1 Tax=Kitasatospora sp. NPDC058965 TaxID=3346682 RepID=UPI0036B73A26
MELISAREAVLEHFRWDGGHADVWAVFRDGPALAAVVRGLVEPFRRAGVTAVVGVESRGFLLGGAAAVQLGVGFVPVRKAGGLFPGPKLARDTDPDYRGLRHTLRLRRDALTAQDRVLLVDDWIETGSQAAAVRELALGCGARWAGCAVVVDQLTGRRRPALGPIHGLLRATDLPPVPRAVEG